MINAAVTHDTFFPRDVRCVLLKYVSPILAMTALMLMFFCLCGCSQHKHTFTEADCDHPATCSDCGEVDGDALGHTVTVGLCARCGAVQGESSIEGLNKCFAAAMDAGGPLITCVEGISSGSPDEQYASFAEADGYAAEMRATYGDILAICGDLPELSRIAYQVRLLENSCPDPVRGSDSAALADQAVLYQLYLRQVSSSFAYLSEDMAHLAGTGDVPNPVTYFDEVPEIPTPDSIIYGVRFDSGKTDSGVTQYMYILGTDEDDANADYNLYLSAIGMGGTLDVRIMDSYVTVEKDGTMVCAMMAGTDADKGYFLTVSFQQ